VNIILKKDFDGVEADIKYGSASGTDETNASLALGKRGIRGRYRSSAAFRPVAS